MRIESLRFGRSVAPSLLAAAILAGCAATAPVPRPADYPFHSAAPPIGIHWGLTEDSSQVRADGLVERQQAYVVGAWLQLLGIDATSRVVSFTAPALFRWRSGNALEPFALTLSPRGGAQRYEVRLYSFDYEEEMRP